MNQQNNTTFSFKGQHFFIGLDVHKKSWKVTIRINKTQIKRFSMDPSPQQLAKHLQINFPDGIYHSVYESGFWGYWIHRQLVELGIDNIIVNPADIPTSHKEKDRRDDKIDSAKLARELENDSLKGIYIPTPQQQSLRSVSRLRYQHRNQITRLKNRIIMFLHLHGIKIPEKYNSAFWSSGFIKWLGSISFEYDYDKQYLDQYIEQLQYQRNLMTQVLLQMRDQCNSNNVLKCFRSVTGIGIISAFTFYSELIDMKRFQDLDHLASYVGSDPVLTAAYAEFTNRMTKQQAIIKIARRLLNRIRYVWLNEKIYVTGVVR